MNDSSLRLKVLHVGPVGISRHQGLFHAILGLTRAQRFCGAHVTLMTTHPQSSYPEHEPFPVIYYRNTSIRIFLSSRDKGESKKPFDLVVFHSTYIPFQARLARVIHSSGIPYIITPHGGMTDGALGTKPWKKKFGNCLFFSRMVRECTALHFLTNDEAKASASWMKPSFVVGNGVDLPRFSSEFMERRGKGRVLELLFIGRLDLNHKGIDLLLDGLARFRRDNPTSLFRLRLYGPAVQGSDKQLLKRIQRDDLESCVALPGPVAGEEKAQALREADLFVLTSRFEGHPISVLEALSYGLPCLLTPGTNVADEVISHGAGWKVDPDPDSIARGIADVFRARGELPETSRKARRLAECHSWNAVAKETINFYLQIIARKQKLNQ